MIKKIVSIFLLISLSFSLAAQTNASKKEIKTYENAVILMNEGKYSESLSLLNSLVRSNRQFVEASWTLAELYSKMRNNSKQIATLQLIAKPKMPRYYNSLMRLAAAYHASCNYHEAIKTYEMVPESETGYYKTAQQRIKQCKDALDLVAHPVPFEVKNMGPNINTKYDDYWPSITADEGWFSVTVKLGKLEGQSDYGKGVHEDIFVSKKVDEKWTPIQNVSTLNTIGNEGAQSFSLDSRYLFFVACDRQTGLGGCDVYYSIRMGDSWSEAINAGAPLNTKYWETYPSLSPTGDELYFASNRPGGQGKSDIWKSKVTILENGMLQFSEPINLGSVVNTAEDELSPFIHADNRTLYYSSKGMKGLGGYDVFVAYKEPKGTWSKPINIGYPLNTCNDEIGFVVNAYGDKAYFSSDGQEKNGQGRDIYEVKLQKGNYGPMKRMKYAKGKIVDAETLKPMQAQIDVFSIKSNETVFRSVSDKKDGGFVACVPEDEDFGVHVSKKGYLFYSDYFSAQDSFQFDIKSGISLDKIEVGKKIILKNIFFDFDEYTLKKESYLELGRLVTFLKQNPRVRIQLAGHTDIKGTREYNQSLSENRAKAAYNYLISKGIAKSRLEYKGYGKDVPIADNSTDAGRALNRRTEIVIIGK
jgi:outer membrane protein OmpA-like peptidoglycan-associated protein